MASEVPKTSLVSENLVWLTSEEAATYLRIPVGSVRNFVYQGILPFYKFQRRLRFKKSDLEKILEASKQGGPQCR